jgi:hypothetical protein
LIDRQGRIASTHIGLGGRTAFEDGVDELLRENDTPFKTGNSAVPAGIVAAK